MRIASILAVSVFVLCMGVAGLPPAAAQGSAAKNRIVVQVSDTDAAKWNLALNNARNLQTDLGAANVEIEIVAYGPGINMLKIESVVANRIGEALGTGVKVLACENTMRGAKLAQGRHDAEASATWRRRDRDHAEAAAGLGLHAALALRDRRDVHKPSSRPGRCARSTTSRCLRSSTPSPRRSARASSPTSARA